MTEFDTLPSKFEKNNRFYDPKGLAPTITTGESIKILNNLHSSIVILIDCRAETICAIAIAFTF